MTQSDGPPEAQDDAPLRSEGDRSLRDRLAAVEAELASAEAQIKRERDIRQREASEHLAQRDRLETRLADLRAAATEAASETVEAQAARSDADVRSSAAIMEAQAEAARRAELEGIAETARAEVAQSTARANDLLQDKARVEAAQAEAEAGRGRAEASLKTAAERARGLEKTLEAERTAAEADAKAAAEALSASGEARQHLESRLAQLQAAVDDAHRETEVARAARNDAQFRIGALEAEVSRLRDVEQELAAAASRHKALARQRKDEHDRHAAERRLQDQRTEVAFGMLQRQHARLAKALQSDAAAARDETERLVAELTASNRDGERLRKVLAGLRSTWLRRRIMWFLGLDPRAPAGD